ncbi:MAG TPA: glycogen-binding domain-containing protein [Draconibacterium sp.]|nr:glycogen-binding domain-containing protein [Draconibacterium sp.]
MKIRAGYILFVFAVCLALNVQAQFDPDKICRIDDGRLIFTINLKWSEKEKKELCDLFDLDSVLISQVFAGKTSIDLEGETWLVKKGKSPLVELSKRVQTGEPSDLSVNDVFLVIDKWMNFGGNLSESQVTWGVNDFSLENAFVYTNGRVWLYLPGYTDARKVYIAGSFNNWNTQQTPLTKVSTGWTADLRLKPGKYTYKYIVDGRWITDPVNRQRENDGTGNKNSVMFCTNYSFELKGFLNAKNVVVTGNFYGWNPKGVVMKKTINGWKLPVYLRDGTYAYKFLVDKRWMVDPANPSVRKDANGNENSFLEIGEPYLFKLDGFADARNVVLTGSFNNWNRTELVMNKTATGWQLSYVVAPGNYEYKFIADGKWMPDPANPFTSGTGNYVNSLIALKANHVFELKGYPEAKSVMVTGSFNGWKRDGYRMSRQNGKWILPLFLNHGKYTYKFIVDDQWILDPDNKLFEENEYGTDNSVLLIEE